MTQKFKYKFDKRSKRITAAVSVMVLAAFVVIFFKHGGVYFPAWVFAFLLCIIALYILSIPRFIQIDDDALEIHCIVDLTRIHVEDIENIKTIERYELTPLIPLIGSYGFFGYYGYYLSLWNWNIYKMYASERKNLIMIEDIYEDTYIISCDEAENLIKMVIEARNNKRQLIFSHTKETNI